MALPRPLDEIFKEFRQAGALVSTGCIALDNLLKGGLLTGEVTEFYGESATGKTQLCHACATFAAWKHSLPVVYIDCSNSFSPKRVATMATAMATREGLAVTVDAVLRSIWVYTVFNVEDVAKVVARLPALLGEEKSPLRRSRLVVVDSFGSIANASVSPEHTWGHARLLSAVEDLKNVASRCHVSVILTTFQSVGSGAQSRTVLDPMWSTVAATRVWLRQAEKGDAISSSRREFTNNKDITATVVKCSRDISRKSVTYSLCQEGLQ